MWFDVPVSFDLGVLAIDGWADVAEVVAMVDRCQRRAHVEGELDQRIVGFYASLRARFPDQPPCLDPAESPWMDMPLDVGIDHVFMSLSYSERSDPGLEMIGERFDADPAGWERDRVVESVRAVRRDQGPERAWALALQLVARGSLSTEDVVSFDPGHP